MAVRMFSWPSLHERMCRTWDRTRAACIPSEHASDQATAPGHIHNHKGWNQVSAESQWDNNYFPVKIDNDTCDKDNKRSTALERSVINCWSKSCPSFSSHLNIGGRRGATDDVATIPFHPFLSSAARCRSSVEIKPEDQWSCKRSPDTWSWYII